MTSIISYEGNSWVLLYSPVLSRQHTCEQQTSISVFGTIVVGEVSDHTHLVVYLGNEECIYFTEQNFQERVATSPRITPTN